MEEARADYQAAIAVSREMGCRRVEASALSNLAILCLDQGRMEEASAHLEEGSPTRRARARDKADGRGLRLSGRHRPLPGWRLVAPILAQ